MINKQKKAIIYIAECILSSTCSFDSKNRKYVYSKLISTQNDIFCDLIFNLTS